MDHQLIFYFILASIVGQVVPMGIVFLAYITPWACLASMPRAYYTVAMNPLADLPRTRRYLIHSAIILPTMAIIGISASYTLSRRFGKLLQLDDSDKLYHKVVSVLAMVLKERACEERARKLREYRKSMYRIAIVQCRELTRDVISTKWAPDVVVIRGSTLGAIFTQPTPVIAPTLETISGDETDSSESSWFESTGESDTESEEESGELSEGKSEEESEEQSEEGSDSESGLVLC